MLTGDLLHMHKCCWKLNQTILEAFEYSDNE